MSVILQYPYASPTVTLTLRNPDLGNSEQYDLKINYGVSMDGSVYTYKYTPTTHKLLLTFNELRKSTVDELISFLKQTSGRTIKLTDHNNVVWQGAISTDPNEITTTGSIQEEDSSSNNCVEVSTVTIEFEGVQV